ncbi:hypothetical protein [Tortoise microvirus 75]|nr:hypothetical protein [Tortoise microvirus 75]
MFGSSGVAHTTYVPVETGSGANHYSGALGSSGGASGGASDGSSHTGYSRVGAEQANVRDAVSRPDNQPIKQPSIIQVPGLPEPGKGPGPQKGGTAARDVFNRTRNSAVRAEKKDPWEDNRPHCKPRPNRAKSKGGGGKGFVPWC